MKGELSNQDTIQVKFPKEMATIFKDLREERAANFEPTSNKSIAIDAVKLFHSKVLKRK